MVMIRRHRERPMIEQSERAYIVALGLYKDHLSRYDVIVPNAHLSTYYEADLLGIRSSGFIDEFEIKLSVSDFNNDKKKTLAFQNSGTQYKLNELAEGNLEVNHFWYVTPTGLITSDQLPDFAGWIEIDSRINVKRHPKRLHARKASYELRFNLAKKLNQRFWNSITPVVNNGSEPSQQIPTSELQRLAEDVDVADWHGSDKVEVSTVDLTVLVDHCLKRSASDK